jgi:hypothetical protein
MVLWRGYYVLGMDFIALSTYEASRPREISSAHPTLMACHHQKLDLKIEYITDMSRFIYRPMKKKAGPSAGIPRASGERNSPVGNGSFPNNQVSLSRECSAAIHLESFPVLKLILRTHLCFRFRSNLIRGDCEAGFALLAPICAYAFTEMITT